jgi:uncharacterized membrane protein YdjX (TVP38/TMEM64 family)
MHEPEGAEGSDKESKGRTWLRVLFPVAASLLGLVTLRLLGPDMVSQQQLSEWIRPLGLWAPVAFVLFLAVRPVTLLPGQIFTAVGGILFGMVAGSVYALLGSLLANILTFWLAKRLGTRFMKRMAGRRYQAIRRTARRHDFSWGLLMCINPLVPTDVMVALAAGCGARLWPTVFGVLVGTIPGTVLTAWFGSALGQGQTALTAVSAAGLVISLVAGVFVGRKAYKELMEGGKTDAEGQAADQAKAAPSAQGPALHAAPHRPSPRAAGRAPSGLTLGRLPGLGGGPGETAS